MQITAALDMVSPSGSIVVVQLLILFIAMRSIAVVQLLILFIAMRLIAVAHLLTPFIAKAFCG